MLVRRLDHSLGIGRLTRGLGKNRLTVDVSLVELGEVVRRGLLRP